MLSISFNSVVNKATILSIYYCMTRIQVQNIYFCVKINIQQGRLISMYPKLLKMEYGSTSSYALPAQQVAVLSLSTLDLEIKNFAPRV